jgi:hypothetical protein
MNNETCRKDIPYPSVSSESVPSLINNLVDALYGTNVTKTVVNRQVIWNIPCDPNNTAQISWLPRNPGEGLLCYIIRAFNSNLPATVTLNGVETLTNKTLTAPAINNPSVFNLVATGSVAFPNGSLIPSFLSTGAPSWNSSGMLTTTGMTVTGDVVLPLNSIGAGVIADGAITNADINNSAGIANSKLAGNPTSSNAANAIVLRDGSGNFSANIISANLTGIASNATNLQGGQVGSIPYQSAAGTTAMLPNTATTGAIFTAVANGAPTWSTDHRGTSTTSNASIGFVGEYVASQITTNVAFTQNTVTNITSISLTAGDWDVHGSVMLAYTTTNSTTFTLQGGISTTASTLGSQDTYSQLMVHAGSTASQTQSFATPVVRVSLATTTTVYLVGFANGGLSSINGKGTICARRMR